MSDSTPSSRRRFGPQLLIEVPAVIVVFVMMGHVVLNAALRTWANSPMRNTLEYVEYWYLPLVAFLGFIAAQLRGQHIAADLIYEMLPTKVRGAVLALMMALCSVVSLGFAWFGWGEAQHAREISMRAGVTDLAAWPTYYLVPLAFGSLTVQFAYAAVRALTRPDVGPIITDPDDALLLDELDQTSTHPAAADRQDTTTTAGGAR